MQFSAVLLFAGAAMATYTTYETVVETVTSCAAYVTNCPAHSTVTHTTSHAVVYTPSGVPAPYHNSTLSYSAVAAPHSSGAAPAPAVVTVTVHACPSASPAPATLKSSVVPHGTSVVAVGTSAPSATVHRTPAFTGAASAVSGSLAMIGFAGLAAIFLA